MVSEPEHTPTPAAVQATPGMKATLLKSGLMLALFALLGAELVSFSYEATREQIAANQRAVLLRSLTELIPAQLYDNDLLFDTKAIRNAALLGTNKPVTLYRAFKDGQPSAVAFMPIAPNGYGGPIKLLVAIKTDGTLLGARVIEHQETPGLGDGIEAKRSPWIQVFNGKSLTNPEPKHWQVKRDGGAFDQFTGATITPRAVVKAVYRSLLFYQSNHAEIFAEPTP